MMKKGLAIAIISGIVLAAYPIYGESLASGLWARGSVEYDNTETITVSGTVKAVELTYTGGYITLDTSSGDVKILVKGEWTLGNESMEYSELLQNYIDTGDPISVAYRDNPRWGPMAEEIVLWDGSMAIKG